MKIKPAPHRRAFAALVPTLALLATPALAQDAQTAPAPTAAPAQTVAPPPVVRTVTTPPPVPVTTTVAPPPVIETAPAPAPVAETAPAPARATPTRAARSAAAPVRRAAPVAAAPAPAPVAAEPAPARAADPVVTEVPAPAPQAAAPVDLATADTATTDTTAQAPAEAQATSAWPLIAGGIVALLAIIGGLLFLRSRRRDEEVVYDEEPMVEHDYVAPVAETPVIAETAFIPAAQVEPALAPQPQFLRTEPLTDEPVIAAVPVDEIPGDAAEVDASLVEAEAEDVAALIAGDAPAGRPWLEFAMRPVRAGSKDDGAMVEFELTVGNSGSIAAKDVRISTFMFAGEPASAEMERLLLERGNEAVEPVTIEAGEGTRIDATLSLSKDYLGEDVSSISPVVVAEARYRLPDGSEGHTSASFTIGMPNRMLGEDAEMRPIAIHGSHMVEDVEARLHGVPEHA